MTVVLHCPDIQCEGCSGSIRRALAALPELQSVRVEVESKRLVLEGTEAAIAAAKSTLAQIGFPPND